MNKICTSIEQSKKLIELGINVNTADMYRWYSGRRYYIESMDDDDFNEESDIPAWSLTALMDVLDRGALFKTPKGWVCQTYIEYEVINSNYHSNPVDACVEMILELHKQKDK